MSAQQLADECARRGLDLSRGTIAKLESGSRTSVALDELLVLAAALEVPPVRLIAPVGASELAEVLPGHSLPSWDAAKWITGDVALTRSGAVEPADPFEPMHLYREHEEHIQARQRAFASKAETGLSIIARDADLARLRAQMRRLGVLPPPLPDELAYLDDFRAAGTTDATQS